MRKHTKLTPIALAFALAFAAGSATAGDWDGLSQEAKDAYREGQIFATYVTNPVLESYEIETDVEGPKVTLTGTVETKLEKALAESIAMTTTDVAKVDNNIKVDPELVVVTAVAPVNPYAQHVHNATVSMRVNSQLLWNEYTDGMDIKVRTENGAVTLTGSADTERAKRRAGEIAAHTLGVRAVDNNLVVGGSKMAQSSDMPTHTDAWMKQKLHRSFSYVSGINGADIKVAVNGDTVTLTGMVDSNLQRQRAINIAQHTRGVDAVVAEGLKVSREEDVASS